MTTELLAGTVLGSRFELGARIAGGLTGAIYAAFDSVESRECVVKLVSPEALADPRGKSWVKGQLAQLQKVSDRGVVKVLAFGEEHEAFWVALERIADAKSLLQQVGMGGPMSPDDASYIAAALARSVASAAAMGVYHEDLSPKNVLMNDAGQLAIVNFLFPFSQGNQRGIPEYMAPEVVSGGGATMPGNVYSIGAIYYFLLTGLPPQAGGTQPAPSSKVPAVSSVIDDIVAKALSQDPIQRYLNLQQLANAIDQRNQGSSVAAAPPPPGSKARTMMGMAVGDLQEALKAKGVEISESGQIRATSQPPASEAPSQENPAPEPAVAPEALATPAPNIEPEQPPAALTPEPQQPPTDSTPEPKPANPAPEVAPETPRPAFIPEPSAPEPVSPSPVAAAPASVEQPSGKRSRASSRESDQQQAQERAGKFRETLWFKKGELDEEAAKLAAQGQRTAEKADLLPVEDRYVEDGSVTSRDRQRLSLKTGNTQMMEAITDQAQTPGVSEDVLVGEMKQGRGKILAGIGVGFILLVAVIVYTFSVTGKKKTNKPVPAPVESVAPTTK